MMRKLLLVVSVAALADAAVPVVSADASCLGPGPTIFPRAGVLPPKPTLYRFEAAPFAPLGAPTQLHVAGPDGPVPFTTRVLATAPVRVTAIEVEIDTGVFTVRAGGREPPRNYRVVPGQAQPGEPLQAETVVHQKSEWTCSYTDGIGVQVTAPGVAVFVARWSDGHEAHVVPDTGGYHEWLHQDAPLSANPGGVNEVFLGHVSCTGHQIPPAYIGREDFTLTAIYPDGTRRAVTMPPIVDLRDPTEVDLGEPAEVEEETLLTRLAAETRRRLAAATPDALFADEPGVEPAAPMAPPGDGSLNAWLALGGLAIAAATLGAYARRRRPTRVP